MTRLAEEKTGFVKTTLGICSGTEIFFKFINIPITRPIIHFIMISLLATTVYAAIKAPALLSSVFNHSAAFDKYFGGLNFTSNGLIPLNAPDKSRTVKIRKIKIDYIPSPDMDYKIDDNGALNGFIWMPKALYFWTKINSGYQYVPILSSAKTAAGARFTASSLDNILNIAKNDDFNFSEYNIRHSFTFSEMRFPFFVITLALYFAGMLLNMLITIPIYSLLILAMFSFFGIRILDKVKTVNLFSIILYSSFPGIIISTIYTALSLPFFDFKTLVFSCTIIYSFFVINALQKKLYPQKQENEDYDDDIF